MMLLATASLVFFLAVAVLDHWVFHQGLSFTARLALFALWVAAAGAFGWRFLLPPLANRINPVFAAQAIEQGRPTLKNSLINFLLLRSHPQDVAPVVFRAMEHRAASDLLKVPVDHAVDRGRIVQLACALAGVIAIFALYLALSPKNPLVSAARVLWPWSSVPAPTRVHIEEVSPGDKTVYNDEREPISALVTGLRDGEQVTLLVCTADNQAVEDRMVMTPADDANHYRCELPQGSGGFQQDTFYRITAGDTATPQYKLDVQTAPTIIVDRIDYQFPPYTGLAERTIKNQGDIKALEGTLVTIYATANMDIKDAHIDLNHDGDGWGLVTRPMTTKGKKATGQLTLALDPDNPGKAQFSGYQILFTDTNGHSVRRPVRYNIDVDRDLPPVVQIDKPLQEVVEMPEDGQLPIHVKASDPDFGLRHVTIQAERETKAGREADQLSLPVLFDRPKPEKALLNVDREYLFRPAELKLKAGDVVHYWATADDNKEPRPNHSETAHRTIKIGGAGQGDSQDQQNPPNGADGQQQQKGDKPGQSGERSKAEKGQGDSSGNKSEESKGSDQGSDGKTKEDGQGTKSQDPKNASSDTPKRPKSGEPNSGESGEEREAPLDPNSQQADAIKESLKDKEKQENGQQDKPQQPNRDQKQNAGQSGGQQQGSPQQDGRKQDDSQKQNGGQGNQQPQGNSGEKKDQGTSGNQPQGSNSPKQAGKPDSTQNNSGNQGQNDRQNPSQGNPKPSPQQQGNTGGTSKADSQHQAGNDAHGQLPQPNGSGQDNKSQSSPGAKQDQNTDGQSKQDTKQASREKSQPNQSAGGSKTSAKQQSGGETSKGESGKGGNPQNSDKPKPGGQGPGDERQVAQGPKPNEPKPSEGAGSDSQGKSGSEKKEIKPKEESGNSPGGGQGSHPKKEESQKGGGDSSGGDKPKSGQGDPTKGSSGGGNQPKGDKPSSNQGGTADSGSRQQDPSKKGNPTEQNSGRAPESQVDRQNGKQKPGDAEEGLSPKSDKSQSPGNSPHDSGSSSQTKGDRKGGGGEGGGEQNKKNGTGAAGTQQAADKGGSVSPEKGDGATGKNAGEAVRATERTDSPRKESGKGKGQPQESADHQTAKNDEHASQGKSTQNSNESQGTSGNSQAGAQSPQQAGSQGGGQPVGGSRASNAAPPPEVPQPPESKPDEANLDFSKKQVDLALEHLKDEKSKPKSELLDRLGWTKEEAQKFLDNMSKLKDSAQRSGNEGESAKKAYNEFLKNLDLHPHITQISGGKTKTDEVPHVRDSGQMPAPAEWADLYHAYSSSTGGKK